MTERRFWFPSTFIITALVIAAGWYTHTNTPAEQMRLLERIGTDVNGFDLRRILAMPFATFVQSSPGVEWHMFLLVALPLALVEWEIGSLRAAATFVLSDWLSAPLTLVAIWALAQLGSHSATSMLDEADAGSSAAAHGTLAVACLFLPAQFRLPAIAALYAYLIAAFWFQRLDASVAHLIASTIGLLIGLFWRKRGATSSA